MKHLAAFFVIAFLLVACTHETIYRQETSPNESVPSELLTLGAACSGQQICASGLTCLGLALDGECTERSMCTLECKDHSECTALDPSARCLDGCNGTRVCTLTRTY